MTALGKWISRKPSPPDKELEARLSRLRSEFRQARQIGSVVDSAPLDEVEHRLIDAERLARATDEDTSQVGNSKEESMRLAHEVEAELCMLKPFELLYPTWTRLRRNLYRFDDTARRDAWEADIEARIAPDSGAPEPDPERCLRQRLRQLTLELRESALGFNRLNGERAAATRYVLRLGAFLIGVFGIAVATCLTFSCCVGPYWASTLVILLGGTAAGGMGAVFSRVAAPRYERARSRYTGLLKWDLLARAFIGAGAALLVAAILLSETIFTLPEEAIARAAFLVVLGFAAGFSDRFFKSMLAQAIGTRRSRSSGDRA